MSVRSKRYFYVKSYEELEIMDEFLMDGDEPRFNLLAFDTETNGVNFTKNLVIGFSISSDAESGFYVPFLKWVKDPDSMKLRKILGEKRPVYFDGHFECVWTGKTYPEDVTPNDYEFPEKIIGYAKRWLLSTDLIMHNAPFDCNMVHSSFKFDITDKLYCDTLLLKHFIDENSRNGLKETSILWSKELGFDASDEANAEQQEMGLSVMQNGGKYNKAAKHIWRCEESVLAKYAIADTALTYGVYNVAKTKLLPEDFESLKPYQQESVAKRLELFYETEIMPLCREVVVPMQYKGVHVDVDYFKQLETETTQAMQEYEDKFQEAIKPHLDTFDKVKTVDEIVNSKNLVEKIIELEGLDYPTTVNKEGVVKKSLAKTVIKQVYGQEPHWLWEHCLGIGEIPYSEEKLNKVKYDLYIDKLGRRYPFNMNSDDHIRWLLFKKLGNNPNLVEETGSGLASVNAESLSGIFDKKYDFIKYKLIYKKLGKLLSTYIKPAIELQTNGWLHVNMNQAGTKSGRFSCSGGFNLQTLPRVEELDKCTNCGSSHINVENPINLIANVTCKDCGHLDEGILCPSAIKAGFTAPEGYNIVNADFSSLEPRCFAWASGDPKLKEVYWSNLDLYSKVHCDMLDEKGEYSADPKAPNFLKKLNPQARTLIKPVVLGIPYGAGDGQVANMMNIRVNKQVKDKKTGKMRTIEVADAEKGKYYRELYLDTYSELKGYMQDCELQATTMGYVETLLGRRRHFEYTVHVQQLLDRQGIEVEKFLNTPRWDLNNENCKTLNLGRSELQDIAETLNMPYNKLIEKGGWGYIRGVFKNELNNSKNVKIQGLGAHITNRAMLEVNRKFKEEGLDAWVCLQIHDEITCYSSEEDSDKAKELLQDCMENNIFSKLIDIPMIAEPTVCKSFKEGK